MKTFIILLCFMASNNLLNKGFESIELVELINEDSSIVDIEKEIGKTKNVSKCKYPFLDDYSKKIVEYSYSYLHYGLTFSCRNRRSRINTILVHKNCTIKLINGLGIGDNLEKWKLSFGKKIIILEESSKTLECRLKFDNYKIKLNFKNKILESAVIYI